MSMAPANKAQSALHPVIDRSLGLVWVAALQRKLVQCQARQQQQQEAVTTLSHQAWVILGMVMVDI